MGLHNIGSTACRRSAIIAAYSLFGLGMVVTGASVGAQKVAATGERSNEAGVAALVRPVTITLKEVPLRTAIDSVGRVAGILVQYRVPLLAAIKTPVSVHAIREPLGVILERLLDGTHVRAVPTAQGHVMLVALSETTDDSIPGVGTVTGRVVDSVTGRGVNGATVKIVGTKISTVTADSGRFALRAVPVGNQVVAVRGFGYRPNERPVSVGNGDAATVRIALAAAPNLLSGVVTTATGERDRRTVGNDITVINADSVMRTAPIKNVTDLLETRVPGLTVTHTSGIPGAPSRLRLRGVGGGLIPGADNTNDPIVIIDGVRIDARQSTQRAQNGAAPGYTAPAAIDQIDPNSVEKIEVFKGPSASSLYGADAANGVIVITTKRGRAGATQVSSALDYEMTRFAGAYAGPGFYQFGHSGNRPARSYLCGGLILGQRVTSVSCIVDSLVSFQALDSPRLQMFATGTNAAGTVSAQGGTSTLTYALTGSAGTQQGSLQMPALFRDRFVQAYAKSVPDWMIRPDLYRTWSGSGALTNTLFAGLLLQYTTSVNNSDSRQSSAQGQVSQLSSSYIDTISFGVRNGAENALLQRIGKFATKVTSHSFTVNNGLRAAWSRWRVFPTTVDVGLSTTDRQDVTTVPYGVYSGALAGSVSDQSRGSYSYGRPTSQTRTLNASGELLPGGRVVTTLGVNVTKVSTQDVYGSIDHLTRGAETPDVLTSVKVASVSANTGGWFVEPRLNFSNRFFMAPGFRIDNNGVAGSRGGIAQTGGHGIFSIFPKMDFSWIALDRQEGTPWLGTFTLIRPRVAFGVGAVQPSAAWLYRVYNRPSFDSTVSPDAMYGGVQLTTIGNPVLRPERSREFEGGGEFELWRSRVSVTATGYVKLRLDAIEVLPIAPSVGGNTLQQYRNLGKIRNSGVELAVQGTPIQNAFAAWTVSANYSANRNVLLTLNGTQPVINMGDGVRLVAGYPLNGRWDRPIIGYTPPAAGKRIGVGNLKIADSATFLGSATPQYTLPVSSTLSLFNGMLGVSVAFNYEHNFTQFASGSLQLLSNLYLDSTASYGQQAAALAAYCTVPGSSCEGRGTTAGVVQIVSALRLNSLSVNYMVPRSFTRRVRVPRATVALQGSNLGLWTSYRGKDPDVNGTPVGEAITDDGQIPRSRSWGLRVTLGN